MLADDIFIPERRGFHPRLAIAGIAVLLAAVAAVLLWRGLHRPAGVQQYLTAPVQRTTLADSISATGPIAAAAAVPLNFKNSGKVVEIDVHADWRRRRLRAAPRKQSGVSCKLADCSEFAVLRRRAGGR
ncbi:MAG: hypothetical protein KGJ86_17445 [Chloroflexota bacterium]|nr:hypothetical protein [Chloroflexota bacterium]